MKNVMLSLILIILCVGESFAQYSLSPRLGNEIDRNEREYFGLFPNINGYISAKLSVTSNHQIEVVVTRSVNEVNTDTSFMISSTVAENLTAYIEDFESYRHEGYSVNWKLLGGVASSGPALEHIVSDGAETIIVTHSGQHLYGRLLYVSDSSIVLWQSSAQFSWLSLQLSGVSVQLTNIESISVEREGDFWSGAGYGTLVGIGAASATVVVASGNNQTLPDGQIALAVGLTEMIGAISGGVIGGIIGSVIGSDISLELGGNIDEYREMMPALEKAAAFSKFPPIEVQTLAKRKNEILAERFNVIHTETIDSSGAVLNAVYSEFASSIFLSSASLNYERSVSQHFSIRAGFGVGGGWGVDGSGYSGYGPMLMALYMTEGNGKFEFGFGGSVMYATVTDNVDAKWWLIPAVSLGYRYQPSEGGLFFRIGLTYDYIYGTPLQISLGHAF